MHKFPNSELTRYYHLIRILGRLIDCIDAEYPNDPKWFMYSLRVGRKFTLHCKSFCLHSADIVYDESNQTSETNSYVDVAGLFTNLRIQMDCYATLHHIFFDDVDFNTRRLRFDLWRYDSKVNSENLKIKDHNDLEQLKIIIEENSNYKELEPQKKKFIFNEEKQFANWKFILTRLSNKTHITSWTNLFEKTGIKLDFMKKANGFLSMYIHSNFYSVTHISTLDKEDSFKARRFAILFSSYLICFAIDDFISKFTPGKIFLKNISQQDYEIIKSFIDDGRIKEMNKNFNN